MCLGKNPTLASYGFWAISSCLDKMLELSQGLSNFWRRKWVTWPPMVVQKVMWLLLIWGQELLLPHTWLLLLSRDWPLFWSHDQCQSRWFCWQQARNSNSRSLKVPPTSPGGFLAQHYICGPEAHKIFINEIQLCPGVVPYSNLQREYQEWRILYIPIQNVGQWMT